MEELEKKNRYQALLCVYRSLLTTRQQELMSLYFFDDLSLQEIADELGVTKSAVHSATKQAMHRLDECEKKLQVVEKDRRTLELLSELKELDEDQQQKIVKIKEMIEHGI